MGNILLKIKQVYRKKEQQEIGDKFIEIMEIIYAIILACGVVKIVEELGKNISPKLLSSIYISVLVLVRFFFAPSKNIKIIGIKGKGWKWLLMPLDVPVLMVHSFIFNYMCSKIEDVEVFYRWFFVLLFVNSLWLFTIWFRLRYEQITYLKVWAVSNLIFFALYLCTYKLGIDFWLLWFILALLNSLIDLGITYSDYFKDWTVAAR